MTVEREKARGVCLGPSSFHGNSRMNFGGAPLHVLLEAGQHRRPVLGGMLARVFSRVVVLRQRHAGTIAFAREIDRHGVIILRRVGLAHERAEMAVLESLARLELE